MRRILESWIPSLLWGNNNQTGITSSDESGEVYYETRVRPRSSSIFVDKDGTLYTIAEELGRGRGGIVRTLKTNQKKDGPELVVKKNLDSTKPKPTDLKRGKEFLCLAYPELAEYIHFFDSEDPNKVRLVMPKLGDTTLARILLERGTRSLNNRYAYIVKALDTLIALQKRGIYHNDAHAHNILFDKKSNCFLIDAENYNQIDLNAPITPRHRSYGANDTEYFQQTYRGNLSGLVTHFSSLDWDDVRKSSIKHFPNHLTLGFNDKTKKITYHLLDLNGKPVKNTITRADAEKLLNKEDFKALCRQVFDIDHIGYALTQGHPLENCLKIILEITSKRGETIRHNETYMSDNFLRNIRRSGNLSEIRGVFIDEMQLNHNKIVGLIHTIHTDLLDCVNALLDSKPTDPALMASLQNIKAQLLDLDIENFSFSHEIERYQTEDALHQLIDVMYQLEHTCMTRPSSYTPTFMSKKPSATHVTSQPFLDKVREELRCNSVHLSEVIYPRETVLKSPQFETQIGFRR